jgi:ketosteroid isomerase-like protein
MRQGLDDWHGEVQMDLDGEAFVARFMHAFNNRDPEAIAAMMTEDAILEVSFGTEPWGTRVLGPAAIRAFYVDMFARVPDAHWHELRRSIGPGHVVVESLHTGTTHAGARIVTMVCDVLTLRDGRIAAKRSYRKAQPV